MPSELATVVEDGLSMSTRAAVNDIVFGGIAGLLSEVFDFPFDLAKVRLQSQLGGHDSEAVRFKGPIDCLVKTAKDEGIRGLYRGLTVPLAGSTLITSAVFLTYTGFQNLIRASWTHRYDPSDMPRHLSIAELSVAGAGSGFLTSFLITPVELVKCRMQVQMLNTHSRSRLPPIHSIPKATKTILQTPISTRRKYHTLRRNANLPPFQLPLILGTTITHSIRHNSNYPRPVDLPGPIAITRSIIAAHGLRGLWLGHTGTILRETGGTAGWFAVKEWTARLLCERRLGKGSIADTSTLLPWESAVSGAAAGAACVLALYPTDTIKSIIQTEEELSQNGKAGANGSSFWPTLVRTYRTSGIRGLYSGCGMMVLRAVPSSGIIFLVYDGLTAWFGQ